MATEIEGAVSITTGSGNFVPSSEPMGFRIYPILEMIAINSDEYGYRQFNFLQVWWNKLGRIHSFGITILGFTIGVRWIHPKKKGKSEWLKIK